MATQDTARTSKTIYICMIMWKTRYLMRRKAIESCRKHHHWMLFTSSSLLPVLDQCTLSPAGQGEEGVSGAGVQWRPSAPLTASTMSAAQTLALLLISENNQMFFPWFVKIFFGAKIFIYFPFLPWSAACILSELFYLSRTFFNVIPTGNVYEA